MSPPQHALPHLPSGTVLEDRFVVGEPVAVGGMATVFRARDLQTGFPVALKVLHEAEALARARFSLEARVLRDLHHPAIVGLIAHGYAPSGELYLVLEWLEGHDLSAHLRRAGGRLSLEDTLEIGDRVAVALKVVHERGILHRDLKPSNVFLRKDQLALATLIDFGVARGPGSHRITADGAVVGTLEYMSPEQLRGGGVLDAATDVYSLGCVLFECLAGRPPFSSAIMADLMYQVLREPAPRLRDHAAVPAGLDDLLARMLAKAPAERAGLAEIRSELGRSAAA